jgi:hypothetical protein
VAVIDEILARQYWPDEDPIGKHIRFDTTVPWSTIVGVVAHVKQADLAGADVKGKYYFPLYQMPQPFAAFLARTSADPARLAPSIREAVRAVDSMQPISQIRLLSDMVDSSLASRRFVVTMLGVFAGLALLMAVIGLYGVIQLRRGAADAGNGGAHGSGPQPVEILRLVLGQGMRLACAGGAIGLAVALVSSRLGAFKK